MTDIDQAYQQKLIDRRMPLSITITGHQDSKPKEGEGEVAQGVGKGDSTGPDAPQMTEAQWRTDPQIQSDLATAYTAFTGAAAPDAETLAQWGIEKISNFNLAMGDITDPTGSNGGGGMIAQATQVLNKFTPDQAGAFARLLDAHDQLPTFTLPGFGRFIRNIATDPTSVVGIATLGAGMAGRQAAKEGVKQALRQRIGQAIVANPLKVGAAEAATYAGAGDAVTQNVKVKSGAQEEYSPLQTAGAVGVGGALGAGMMAAAPYVGKAVKKGMENLAAPRAPKVGPGAQVGAVGDLSQLKRVHSAEVSPRRPTAVKATEHPVNDLLQIDARSIARNPEGLKAQMDLVETYPNYRPAASAVTPEQKMERYINHLEDNLLWLYNQVPEDIKARSHLWYDGANKIANRWAQSYVITDAQAAGVLAALSPQKDWYTNVSLAKRVLDIMKERQNHRWDHEMQVTAERIFGKEQYQLDVGAIVGKTLAEITDLDQKAMWLRVYDETHNSRHFPVITPEGNDAMLQRNFPSKNNPHGELSTAAWGSTNMIAKAISIVQDGSLQNIDAQLGNQHKVRSFYNNILVPNSKNGHVTIDTHAVAAATLRPLSGNSREVAHNFGGNVKGEPGPGGSAIIGYNGTYGMYAEAYRRAAAKIGILPRELQSITWEAVRGLFERENKKMMDFDHIWADYKKGKVSLENTRQRILDAAGGINPPTWYQRPGLKGNDPGRSAADQGSVVVEKLPGRSSGPSSGRGSGRGSGTTNGVVNQVDSPQSANNNGARKAAK